VRTRNLVLLGGTGFVGRHLIARLVAQGHRVRVLSRNAALKPEVRVLPNVQVDTVDVYDPSALAKAFEGVDAVINLVGILHSRDVEFPYSRDFAEAHVELPKKIVAACKAAGVRRLVQMSALKAKPEGPSEYLASKAAGEQVVLAAQGTLDITVFRPSVIFGLGDSFLTMFSDVLKTLPVFPLGFGHARFQPVWVGDVADAFVNSLENSATFGHAYDLCGPKTYTLREMVEYTAKLSNRSARIVPLCDALAYLQAGLMWLAPKPLMSPDNLRSLQVDSVWEAGMQAYPGWKPTALEAVAPTYIARQVAKGRLDSFRHHAGR